MADARALHFVIRSIDLRVTYDFLAKVFEMRVLRHEENHQPCGISCNGPYNSAWSKTMMGYGVEDVSYCFEITYNYGVKKPYTSDGSIQFFAIVVADVAATIQKAKDLGYSVDVNNIITGPDAYPYKPVSASSEDRKEPFAGVSLHASSVEKSVKFYTEVIGMKELTEGDLQVPIGVVAKGAKVAYVAFDRTQVVYQLVEFADGITVASGWQGRNALGPADVTPIYERHTARNGQILHEKRVLKEDPLMEIFIGKDPDGYELCLITHAQFSAEAASATDFKEPDWERRDRFLKTHEWEFDAPTISSSNIGAEDK